MREHTQQATDLGDVHPPLEKGDALHVRRRRAREQPRRVDGWLMVIFGCTSIATLLVIAAVLRWPIPSWIYAVVFPLCLLMPLWVAWRYRRLSRGSRP